LYGNTIGFVITYGSIDEIVEVVDRDVARYHWPKAIFHPKMDFYWWNRWHYWPTAKMLGGLEQTHLLSPTGREAGKPTISPLP
jgi:hypothetical protein